MRAQLDSGTLGWGHSWKAMHPDGSTAGWRHSWIGAQLHGALINGVQLDAGSSIVTQLDGSQLDGCTTERGMVQKGHSWMGEQLDGAQLDGCTTEQGTVQWGHSWIGVGRQGTAG